MNNNRCILIRNLDKSIDNQTLFDTFSVIGEVEAAEADTVRGWGFVRFVDSASAQKAVQKVTEHTDSSFVNLYEVDGMVIAELMIKVSLASEEEIQDAKADNTQHRKLTAMEDLIRLVQRHHINKEQLVCVSVNGNEVRIKKSILEEASATISHMLDGDCDAVISWKVFDDVEPLIIRYLATGQLDGTCKKALMENPHFVPKLIFEGLKLEADPLLQALLRILEDEEYLEAVSNTKEFSDEFIPFDFFLKNFEKVSVSRGPTQQLVCRRLMKGGIPCNKSKFIDGDLLKSSQYVAFERWLSNSADNLTNRFLKKLCTW